MQNKEKDENPSLFYSYIITMNNNSNNRGDYK